jgi:hypothetical protein
MKLTKLHRTDNGGFSNRLLLEQLKQYMVQIDLALYNYLYCTDHSEYRNKSCFKNNHNIFAFTSHRKTLPCTADKEYSSSHSAFYPEISNFNLHRVSK